MSWNVSITGQRKAVAARVVAERYIPDTLKKAIVEVVELPGCTNGVRVTTNGHVDSAGGGIGKLEIENVQLEIDPPAPPS